MEKKTQTKNIGNGRYQLEKTLGRGGFGVTWLATDQENHQKVVIKELCPPEGEKREKETWVENCWKFVLTEVEELR